MEVGELIRLLRRRWKALVPMLVLTVVAVGGAWTMMHTQYQSQVQLAMMNAPKVTNEPGNDGNPFLSFDANLGIDADFLARNITSGSSQHQLASLGMTDSYTAEIATNALGPFIQVSVTGSSRQQVTQAMNVLIHFTERRWTELQRASNAPSDSIIGMSVIAPPGAPAPVQKRKIEAVAGVAIGGLVLSVLVPVLADSIARRRVARRSAVKTNRDVSSPVREDAPRYRARDEHLAERVSGPVSDEPNHGRWPR